MEAEFLRLSDALEVSEAVDLLLGMKPSTADEPDQSKLLRELAYRAIEAGALPCIGKKKDRMVAPSEFARWAAGKGYEVPPEVPRHQPVPIPENLRPTANVRETQKEWGFIHDTKLLKAVRWVTVTYWEGKDPKDGPTKDLVVEKLQALRGLTKNEAEAVDLVTRPDSRRRSAPEVPTKERSNRKG